MTKQYVRVRRHIRSGRQTGVQNQQVNRLHVDLKTRTRLFFPLVSEEIQHKGRKTEWTAFEDSNVYESPAFFSAASDWSPVAVTTVTV